MLPPMNYVILGGPFLKTARAKIDVEEGSLFVEFNKTIRNFSVRDDFASINPYAFNELLPLQDNSDVHASEMKDGEVSINSEPG